MEKSTRELPVIRKEATFKAPLEKVWAAVATSDGIATWFMPNTFEPVAGYEFTLDSGAFGISPCKVTELDPPHRLSFQWGEEWTITFELTAVSDAETQFTLIHAGWKEDMVTPFGQTHAEVRERMSGGWVGLVQKLGELVEA